MFSPIFSPIFVNESFSVWAVEKWNKNLTVQNMIFFLSSPVEKEIITNIRRFGIRNWWNYLINPSIFLLHITLFCSAKVWKLPFKVTPLKMLEVFDSSKKQTNENDAQFLTNYHRMETQNLVISFDYSRFLAKNLAF